MKKNKSLAVSASNVWKGGIAVIAAVYLLGLFMGALDTGIVTPARTLIQNNLQVDEKTGIWMITIYTLAYASSIPIMGKLADRFGRKYIYLTAVLLFGVGSLFCGLSEHFGSFSLLLAARVVQAIGGGGIVPVATAEFGTTFPPEKRGMALGLVGGVYGIANIFGSSAGSAILDLFGKNNWQYIFYVNVPITIFILIAGLVTLPNNKTEKVAKIDFTGIFLLVAMILSLLYGLKNINFFDFSTTIRSTSVYPFLLAFLVLLPFFVVAEKKAADPVINLDYFTNKNIVITLGISFITGIVMMGMVFIPQFSENAVMIASGSGGYFTIILGLFAGVGAPVSGKFVDKYGAKIVLLFGFFVSVIGSLFLMFVAIPDPGMATVSISLLLIGLGMGFTIGAPLNYMMLQNTRADESNSALAALSLIRSIGTTIAPAIMIAFIAQAGASIQDKEMALLPKEINAPALPYAQELTDRISKLKGDPNMKDKLAGIEMPDIASMTKIEIKMDKSSGLKMPDDLVEKMKSADVTNITDRIKLLASTMFDEMTPDVIANIQDGVQKGTDTMQTQILDLDSSISDLQKGSDGVSQGIKGMKKAAEGMESGINGMKTAISRQDAALGQMNNLYSQMNAMMSGAGNKATASGMPASVGAMGTMMPGAENKATTSEMPASVAAMPGAASMSGDGAAGGPAPSGAKSILDMIPAQVKAKIPASVLEQLSSVKTPADLKKKINELERVKATLAVKLSDLEKQHSDMLAKISETESKHDDMLKAIASMRTAKTEMKDTVTKMTTLKDAVPQAFADAKTSYLAEIDTLKPELRKEFQTVLNEGFWQMYLLTAIAALAAIMILFLYGRKKQGESEEEKGENEGVKGHLLEE